MGTTYQTEPVLGEYKTAKQDKAHIGGLPLSSIGVYGQNI